MERSLRLGSKLGIAILEGSLEGAISGAVKAIGAENLGILVDNNWFIIESIFYSIRHPPVEVYKQLNPKEVPKLEQIRGTLTKTVLPLLGMVKFVASKFPPSAIEYKVTPEWLLKRGRKRFPTLVRVVEKRGEKGQEWMKSQCREIVLFATGRLVWDDSSKTMIEVVP